MSCQKKKNILLLFEKRQFSSNFNSFQRWNKTLYQERPFDKNIALSYIFHMPPMHPFEGWAIPVFVKGNLFYGFLLKPV